MTGLRGLPARVLGDLGITRLYPPQEAAIKAGVLEGENVLVAAPTASGKTLIALLAAAAVLERGGGRVFYAVPLRSIALEKFKDFRVLERHGYSVRVSVGDLERGLPTADVVVTTYEKLDSTLRGKPDLLDSAGLVVLDEIHYVGDPKRGPTLEILAARVLQHGRPQVIALSATVSNAGEIAEWLGARLVESDWRPVPLLEGVFDKSDYTIIYPDGGERRVDARTGNTVVDLVHDVVAGGGQALVFVQSRRRAVQLAKQLARYSSLLGGGDGGYAREARATGAPSSIREEVASLLGKGVAYHHGGLGTDLREVVERAFRDGAVKVVVATPTLAAGVNLPARRVIVAEYYRFEGGVRAPISVAEYKQLAGRAGRPGLDPVGESVIIPQGSDDPLEVMEEYVEAEPEPVESKLSGLRGVRHGVLGLVASGVSDVEGIRGVMARTLYARQAGASTVRGLIERAVEDLASWGLLARAEDGDISLTPLGAAAARYYVDPYFVPKALGLARRLPQEPSDAQLIYVISAAPDMPRVPVGRRETDRILDILLDKAPEVFDLIEYVGPEEAAAAKTTLILLDWVEEAPEDKIVDEYDIGPGDLSALAETARWLAAALAAILEASGERVELAGRLRILEKRVKYGVRRELLPLVQIPGIGRVRARRLYEHGYRLPQDLALADPKELSRIPGIGPSTVAAILEFLGRPAEARHYRLAGESARKGLLAFMED